MTQKTPRIEMDASMVELLTAAFVEYTVNETFPEGPRSAEGLTFTADCNSETINIWNDDECLRDYSFTSLMAD